MLPGPCSETRRKYVPVGSSAASMRPTVSEQGSGNMAAQDSQRDARVLIGDGKQKRFDTY